MHHDDAATSVEYETPPLIKSVEDDTPDEFTRTKINPIVGYLVSSARGAEMCGLPASADWEYLREGTRRIQALMAESAAHIAALEAEVADLRKAADAEARSGDEALAENAKLRESMAMIMQRSSAPDVRRLAAEALA